MGEKLEGKFSVRHPLRFPAEHPARSLALIPFMTNFCRGDVPRYLTTSSGTTVNIWDGISLTTPN